MGTFDNGLDEIQMPFLELEPAMPFRALDPPRVPIKRTIGIFGSAEMAQKRRICPIIGKSEIVDQSCACQSSYSCFQLPIE